MGAMSGPPFKMKPKLRVWVTFGDDLKFGDGRARLLEAIEQRGSLKKAAEAFEMSYRNAWGYLRELEHAAGFKFVERAPGGGPAAPPDEVYRWEVHCLDAATGKTLWQRVAAERSFQVVTSAISANPPQ